MTQEITAAKNTSRRRFSGDFLYLLFRLLLLLLFLFLKTEVFRLIDDLDDSGDGRCET